MANGLLTTAVVAIGTAATEVGRPQDEAALASTPATLASRASLIFKDLLSLSTSLEWNLLRDDCEPVLPPTPPLPDDIPTLLFGGEELLDEEVEDLDGEGKEVRECLRAMGADRCGGDPVGPRRKSLPGDVDRDGPSDLHSDTLRLLAGLEHSELRRERFDR